MAGTHGPSVMWYMQVSYKSGNVLRGEHDTVCIELIASSLEGTYHLCIRSRWCVFLETWNSAGLLEVTVCVSNPWLFWLWIYDMVVELLTIQDPSFLSFPCCANPPCCFFCQILHLRWRNGKQSRQTNTHFSQNGSPTLIQNTSPVFVSHLLDG